jgi:flavin reductase (DIM6/NTAB) family NADH-FMN oxidoreductase RutF
MDTKAFRTLSYGMYIVASGDAKGKAGCVVNTFAQVTGNPARATVAVNKDNVTAEVIRRVGRYTASVLTEEAPMTLIGRVGFRSSADYDKFAETVYAVDSVGMPTVTDHAAACFEVRVTSTIDVGSHWLFIGDVEDAHVLSSDAPMTYSYYHQVKGGKTPPKASSYIDEEKSVVTQVETSGAAAKAENVVADDAKAATSEGAERGAKADAAKTEAAADGPAAPTAKSAGSEAAANAESDNAAGAPNILKSVGESSEPGEKPGTSTWRCLLCGYQVTVDGDELPADFTCPMCGAGRDMFERVK